MLLQRSAPTHVSADYYEIFRKMLSLKQHMTVTQRKRRKFEGRGLSPLGFVFDQCFRLSGNPMWMPWCLSLTYYLHWNWKLKIFDSWIESSHFHDCRHVIIESSSSSIESLTYRIMKERWVFSFYPVPAKSHLDLDGTFVRVRFASVKFLFARNTVLGCEMASGS